MESVTKKKIIFAVIVVIVIMVILACLHFFPFWVSVTNVVVFFIGAVVGWFARVIYEKYIGIKETIDKLK